MEFAKGMEPMDQDSADVDLGQGWYAGEEEFGRGSTSGVPGADFVSNQASMNESGYFTNLINEGGSTYYDWSALGSQPEDPEPQVGKGKASVRPNQKRSKNFSMKEDVLLVSAWINISMDAIQGLINLGLLQAEVLYKKDDEKDRSFQFMHCYKFLKDQPKWIEWRIQKAAAKNSNKQKTNANSTPATAAPTGHQSSIPEEVVVPDDSMPSGRPAGRKKEKEKQRKGSDQSKIDALDHLWAKKKETDVEKERQKAERYKVAFALDQQRIDLDKEKFVFKRMIEEDRLLRLDTSAMSIEKQEYYKSVKSSILSRHSAQP